MVLQEYHTQEGEVIGPSRVSSPNTCSCGATIHVQVARPSTPKCDLVLCLAKVRMEAAMMLGAASGDFNNLEGVF